MEKVMNFIKGMFVKEDGINWLGIAAIAGGVLLGGFTGMFGLLPAAAEGGFSLMGALAGAGAGIGVSALISAIMPSSNTAEVTPDATPSGRTQPVMGGPQPDIQPPMAGPARPQQPRGR